MPMMPSNSPNMIIASALISEPCASTTAATKPNTYSEQRSGGPNLNASAASGGANAAISNVPTQPAKNEPIAAIDNAAPARPWRAI